MSDIPTELHYTSDHEWLRRDDDGTFIVGITEFAQAALGDLVFVELPEPGTRFERGDACALVESVKAAADVYAPLSGEVIEVNDALATSPERINESPFGDGWMLRMRASDESALEELLDAKAYRALLDEQS